MPAPRMYTELAEWWPLLSAPSDYAEEAATYQRLLLEAGTVETVLELGSGGGNNASHLKRRFRMTLVDMSSGMLDVSRALNPECEHIRGDMRTVRLDRGFDAVFIHDAIGYMTTRDDLARAFPPPHFVPARSPSKQPSLDSMNRLILAPLVLLLAATSALAWGFVGHDMIARVALAGMPDGMPGFFTRAADQLAYLGPEPDRWRDGELTLMDEAWKYDHYIDLENVPTGALDAADRFEYLEALYQAGLEEPEQSAGFLPWRILEVYQRLTSGFARWRLADGPERAWIEQRIINDAGILGHYVADASNPHHSTIHFNGWAETAPNPRGFTTSDDFHWRFESAFVAAHVTLAEVRRATPDGVLSLGDVRAAIMDYIGETNDQVVRLYELEQQYGFDPAAPPAPAIERFTLDRLATGATMLRSLWYQAWRDSRAVAQRFELERQEP